MKTQKMKPLQFFAPITRFDENKRIVTGTAFANEVVDGEGGVRLRASAMEDATPDYMKFGTIRSMHQPLAAGTAVPNDPDIAKECGVFWSDQGVNRVAEISCYISDETEWKKVIDGTYKGFSVGVAPKVMRGKNVESCTWYETSLVDRPKDPGALFTAVRVDGMPEEIEVEVHEDERLPKLLEDYTRLAGSTSFTKEQKAELLPVIERAITDAGGEVTRIETQTAEDVPTRKDYDSIVSQADMDAACENADKDDYPKLKAIAEKKGLSTPKDWDPADKPEKKPESDEDAKRSIEAALKRMDWDKEARDALPKEDFGWPEEEKFPIKDQEDMDAATKLVGRESPDEQDKIKSRLRSIAKRKGLNLPESWEDGDTTRTVIPVITRALIEEKATEFGLAVIAPEELTRLQGLETQVSALSIERDESKTELSRVQGLFTAAEGEIKRLKDMPNRVPPVRHLSATEKVFGFTPPNPELAEIERLEAKKKDIETTAPRDQKDAELQAATLLLIDDQLARLGRH